MPESECRRRRRLRLDARRTICPRLEPSPVAHCSPLSTILPFAPGRKWEKKRNGLNPTANSQLSPHHAPAAVAYYLQGENMPEQQECALHRRRLPSRLRLALLRALSDAATGARVPADRPTGSHGSVPELGCRECRYCTSETLPLTNVTLRSL